MNTKLNEIYNLLERIDGTFRNYMMLNEELILEAASLADVYQKYYSQIPEEEFKQIVSADPTSGEDKMGKYSKWLLSLYTGGNLKLEDLYKATQYLTTFHKYKQKLAKKDIGQYKSLPELYNAIEPYADNTQAASHKEEIRQIKKGVKKVYEDDEWLVVIPETKEAAMEYGKHTQWCTAAENNNRFHFYNNQGPLYININKKTGEKYQFHFESNQFMDETDSPVSGTQIGLNDNILEFYKKTKPSGYLSLISGGEPEEMFYIVENMIEEGIKPEDIFIEYYDIEGSSYRVAAYNECHDNWGETTTFCVLIDENYNILTHYFAYVNNSEGFILARGDYSDEGYYFINVKTLDCIYNPENGEAFEYADSFNGGYADVESDKGENILRTDGTLVSKEWFSHICRLNWQDADSPLIVTNKESMENLMDFDGNLLSNEWFTKIEKGSYDYDFVTVKNKENKMNYLVKNDNGQYELFLDEWYTFISLPQDGTCLVSLEEKWNVYDLYQQKLLFNGFTLDLVRYLSNDAPNAGLLYIKMGDKCNIADIRNGSPRQLCKQWFDDIKTTFNKNGFAAIKLDDKYYFINKEGEIADKTGYDDIQAQYSFMGFDYRESYTYFMVRIGDRCNFMGPNLELRFRQWLERIEDTWYGKTAHLISQENNPNLLSVSFYGDDEYYVLDIGKGTIQKESEFYTDESYD